MTESLSPFQAPSKTPPPISPRFEPKAPEPAPTFEPPLKSAPERPQLALVAPAIYTAVAFAFFYPLAELTVAVAAAISAGFATLFAAKLARSWIRTWVVIVGALGGTFAAAELGRSLSDSHAFARLTGASEALLWGNLVSTVLGTACFALGLRALSLRRRIFSLVEVLCVG